MKRVLEEQCPISGISPRQFIDRWVRMPGPGKQAGTMPAGTMTTEVKLPKSQQQNRSEHSSVALAVAVAGQQVVAPNASLPLSFDPITATSSGSANKENVAMAGRTYAEVAAAANMKKPQVNNMQQLFEQRELGEKRHKCEEQQLVQLLLDPMEKLGLDVDDGSLPVDAKSASQQEECKAAVQRLMQLFEHACQCSDANCQFPYCQTMKSVFIHGEACKMESEDCTACTEMILLCCYHVERCQKTKCFVPPCSTIKSLYAQFKLQKDLKDCSGDLQ